MNSSGGPDSLDSAGGGSKIDARRRLEDLNSGLSGDIILLSPMGREIPAADRFYFDKPLASTHGSMGLDDSVVRILVGSTGGDAKTKLRSESEINALLRARGISIPGRGDPALSNSQVGQYLKYIITARRE